MSNFKLEFTLKQHTPMIHFQHDQAGATLRATELKPKLDKFILKKIGDGNYKSGIQKAKENGWLIGNDTDKPALDYKVRIKKIQKYEKNGNVVIIPPDKDNWIMSYGVNITLTSFKTDLLLKFKGENNEPSNLLKEFFVLNNFGKRQSKGFGAFYPKTLSKKELEVLLLQSGKDIYLYNRRLNIAPYKDKFNPAFFYIKIIIPEWQRLKSGKNFHGYEKSRVFQYLIEKKFRWDKRWIKRQLNKLIENQALPYDLKYEKEPIDINNNNTWNDNTNEEYRYGRAMLGLAEHYEYLTANKNYKYQVIVDGGEIERFKSPITFKIFEENVYAIIEDIPDEIFNTSFQFKVQKKRKQNRKFIKDGKEITIDAHLFTPLNTNEFDIKEFSKKYLQDINFNSLKNVQS